MAGRSSLDAIAARVHRPPWWVRQLLRGRKYLSAECRRRRKPRTPRVHYTTLQVETIRNLWGAYTTIQIARKIGRTPKGVRSMAFKLGLRTRGLQGFESIRRAATRHGVTYHVMREALKYAGLRVQQRTKSFAGSFTHKKPGTAIERSKPRYRTDGTRRAIGRHRVVAVLDADMAIEMFRESESLHRAEARSGMHEKGLVRALAKIGVVRPKLAPKCIWRIAKADVDRAVAVYVGGETLCDAAQRIGVSRDTMRVWLRAVGLLRTRLATYTTEELQLAIDAARARPYARARALQVAA